MWTTQVIDSIVCTAGIHCILLYSLPFQKIFLPQPRCVFVVASSTFATTVSLRWTYLLTPWCRVLLEQLTGLQLVKKFPAFHGNRRFITALTSVRHLSLPCVSSIQSTYPHPTSWRSILILSTHLRLALPIGLFPSGFPTKTLHIPSPHPYAPHVTAVNIWFKYKL